MPDLQNITTTPAAPPRPADAHKGTFGTVMIVGGSATMIGAPAITARAAFRTGSGLVKLAVDSAILPFALTIEPGATGLLFTGELDHRLAALDAADPDKHAVLAVGPGMGQAREAGELVVALLRGKRPVVLDADGLNQLAWSDYRHTPGGAPLVLTPHPGEFRRLATPMGIRLDPTRPDQRTDAAAALAQMHQAVVVLKGQHTVVCDGDRVFVNDTGHPALATAGSGDVLTGVIASLIGQGLAPFDAAVLGVHAHGCAAEQWAAAHGRAGLRAIDLCDELPAAIEKHRL
ncbi:NAD(P)H-hydrate dehydratase [Phycisphaerales bacterium AB-hyl4]|uniref:ADP-dependent (S)-NAD(P)H-hydrate dehydratase n=1 Tax=Natronomicrosphaera hydrolytica TaxID=3242702 RepID=A0ABV4U0M5_9BACT